jgi:hypothetical protein
MTGKLAIHLGASLSATVALLVGLVELPKYPTVGPLLATGGMALLPYAISGWCAAPGLKN